MAVLAVSAAALGQPAGKGGAPAATGAATAGATAAASADPAADAKRAELEKHFNAGIDFAAKRQWAKAVEELTAAYRIKPLPQIAGNLGEAELQVGNYRDAAEHVEKYLREEDPTQVTAADRKRAEAWLAKAKKNVAALSIRVTLPTGAAPSGGGAGGSAEGEVPSGVEILVDDKKIDLSPFPKEIYVEPGKHTIVARTKTGNARDEVWGEYPKGTAQEVKLELKAQAPATTGAPSASSAPSVPPETPSGSVLRPTLLIGGGVVALGLLATGVGLVVAADGKTQELKTGVADLRTGSTAAAPCKNPSSALQEKCSSYVEMGKSRDTLGNAAVGVLVVGGTVALATVGYLILPSLSRSNKAMQVVPFATATEGGAFVRGNF